LSGVRPDLGQRVRVPDIDRGNRAIIHARGTGELLAASRPHVSSSDLAPAAARGFPATFPRTASAQTTRAMLGSARGTPHDHAIHARAAFRSRRGGGIMKRGATGMSTPVTRGELREELAQLEIRLEQKLEQKFDQKLERLEQRFDQKLELWGGALLARIAESEQRLLTEMARHINAAYEAMTKQISAIDEKYADLPARVRRLEDNVFVPRRR
jgi:hypothetical protein